MTESELRALSKAESITMLVGAGLMVVGAAMCIFAFNVAPYLFAMGAIAFTLMQFRQSYNGQNMAIKRLRRIIIFSDVMFLISAVLMFAGQGNAFDLPLLFYIRYIHNNWVVTLLIAALIQLYAVHRISAEIEKEAKKS